MTAATGTAHSRLRSESPLRRLFSRPETGALIGAILVFVIFAYLAGNNGFLGPIGVAGYLQIAAQIGILGAPVALLMIAGEFDLSLGSMIGITSVFLALMIAQYGLDPAVAVVLTFGLALCLGAVNGLLVVRTRLPSFLITLASMLVLRGVTIAMTREITNQTIVRLPPGATEVPLAPVHGACSPTASGRWLPVSCCGGWRGRRGGVYVRTDSGLDLRLGGWPAGATWVPDGAVKITLFMTTVGRSPVLVIVVPTVGSATYGRHGHGVQHIRRRGGTR